MAVPNTMDSMDFILSDTTDLHSSENGKRMNVNFEALAQANFKGTGSDPAWKAVGEDSPPMGMGGSAVQWLYKHYTVGRGPRPEEVGVERGTLRQAPLPVRLERPQG